MSKVIPTPRARGRGKLPVAQPNLPGPKGAKQKKKGIPPNKSKAETPASSNSSGRGSVQAPVSSSSDTLITTDRVGMLSLGEPLSSGFGSGESGGSGVENAAPDVRMEIARRPGFGQLGDKVNLSANVWELQVDAARSKFYVYEVEVKQLCGQNFDKEINLTDSKCNKWVREKRRQLCYDAVRNVIKANEQVFGKVDKSKFIAYDRNQTLVSPKPIETFENDMGNGVSLGTEFEWCLREEPGAGKPTLMKFNISFKVRGPSTFMDIIDMMNDPRKRDMKEANSLKLMEIITNQPLYESHKVTQYGRSFFWRENRPVELGLGREKYEGLFKSLKPILGNWMKNDLPAREHYKLGLVIDVSNSAFYKAQPCTDWACEIFGERLWNEFEQSGGRLTDVMVKALRRNMKDVAVKVSNGEIFTVHDVTKEAAKDVYIQEKGNKRVSLAAKYNFSDKEAGPYLPCLVKHTPQKNISFPLHACAVLPNQRVARERATDAELTRIMIKECAKPPADRFALIKERLGFTRLAEDPLLLQYAVKLVDQLECQGRILPAPQHLELGGNRRAAIELGTFRMQNQRFYAPVKIKNWFTVVFADPETYRDAENGKTITNFMHTLAQRAHSHGIDMALPSLFRGPNYQDKRPYMVYYPGNRRDGRISMADVQLAFRQLKLQEPGFQEADLVLCIIPNNSPSAFISPHDAIKYATQVDSDVTTQCIKMRNAVKIGTNDRGWQDLATNLCMKINAKLGGVNWALREPVGELRSLFAPGETMVMGADVTHPPPRRGPPGKEDNQRSIVAVVGSRDETVFQHTYSASFQKGRREFIENMQFHMKKCLRGYFNENRCFPKRVVMFRDGVADSMFDRVLIEEFSAMKEGCEMMELESGQRCDPKITFALVVKRHHIRFDRMHYQMKHAPDRFGYNPTDRNVKGFQKNLVPGTVVDRGVTHPQDFEFYLAPHQGIQGTTRPIRVVVLKDEIGFTADQFQLLTYHLCYTFPRCARSVSMPSSAYLAHILADDMRATREKPSFADDSKSDSAISDTSMDDIQSLQKLLQVPSSMEGRMFNV